MMNRVKGLALALLLFLYPLYAQSPEIEEMQTALQGVGSAVFATFAANTAYPSVQLDGVTMESSSTQEGVSRTVISYLRSDVWSMGARLQSPDNSGSSILQRILSSASSRLSPVTRMAVDSIDMLQIAEGDIILDGTVSFSGESLDSDLFNALWRLYIMRDFSSVDLNVDVSLIVWGRLFALPLAFEGRLHLGGSNEQGSLILTTESMTCNNLEITIAPMYFRIG